MKLSALLLGLHELPAGAADAADIEVDRVTLDSRRVQPGSVFVASAGVTPGSKDGHAFIADAVRAGAAVVVVADAARAPAGVPVIVTATPRVLAAQLAERVSGAR